MDYAHACKRKDLHAAGHYSFCELIIQLFVLVDLQRLNRRCHQERRMGY